MESELPTSSDSQTVDVVGFELHNDCLDDIPTAKDPIIGTEGSLKSRLVQKIYQRENQQVKLLLQAYDRLKNRQTPEFILISGPCGSGKTQLAKTLSKAVHGDGGMLLTGKFDPLRKPEPYKAFVGAFTEYASLISQNQQKLDSARDAILAAVGDGAGVITNMIPALEGVIGRRRVAKMNKRGAISSFVFVFQMFVKALGSPEHPLVIVLEDMQWSDPCSLDLLTSLITDVDNKGAVFIGTCEENLPSDSPLSSMLRKLEDTCGVKIVNIQLENFSSYEVQQILSHELQLPQDQISELAEVMLAQTNGNLFYLTEFAQWLEEEQLLKYDQSLMQWKWDKEEILLTISCSCVGDFLIDKLERLPPIVREVLTVASCLDSVLDEELLRVILDFDVRPSLEIAAEHGFLVADGRQQTFSFAHDVMQSAAYAKIPLNNRNAFHLTIGRKMRMGLDPSELEKHIFTVVGQFCLSADIIQEEEERVEVATLCLHAGRMAAKSSTFRMASVYLKCGIQLLGPDCWREQYDLSLQLHNAAAEMALCTASYSEMDDLLNAVFKNIHVFQDRMQAYATRIFSLGVRDMQQQAIAEGQDVLKQLGERIPEHLYTTRLLREMARVRKLVRGKSDAMLMRLDSLNDPTKLAALQILDLMFLSSLIARPTFVPFIILKMMKLTLQHGLSPWSANSFALYGILCCKVGNVDEAFRFGQLALQLLEQSQRREFLPRVYAAVYGKKISLEKPKRCLINQFPL